MNFEWIKTRFGSLIETVSYWGKLFWINAKQWYKIISHRIYYKVEALYYKFKIDEIVFFFLFISHRYSPKQFNPLHVSQNLRMLIRAQQSGWLTTSREGKLILLSTRKERRFFFLKNILLFGALRKRVEKVVYFTYVTITLELNNPFSKKVLLDFLEKKIALLERLLDYVKIINGKFWDQSDIRLHINVYYRNSLLQAQVIKNMHLAVKRQKEPEIVIEVKKGIKKGIHPLLIIMGVSGSYWMRGPNREVLGLFKPFDEEIHAPNNPVGPRCQGAMGLRKTRRGCLVGEAAHHEVGAFTVDEYFGFGIVPRTYYASFSHRTFFLAREDRFASRRVIKTKLGSFQEYVGGFTSFDSISKEERDQIPIDEFQLLVLLDVIIGNTDRNIGNILVGDEKIAAIDHGLCFPDCMDDLGYWYWSYFQQGKETLLLSIVDLLDHFPFDALGWKLKKKCFISLDAVQRMRERVVLFREGVHAGLCIKDLEELMKPEYLYPLIARKSTLQQIAQKQVEKYRATLS